MRTALKIAAGVLGGGGKIVRYNLDGGLQHYLDALAGGFATMLVTGDSIGAGVGTTDPANDAWPNKIKANLISTYGDAGRYVAAFNNDELAEWTLGTGWASKLANDGLSYGYRGLFSHSSGDGNLTISANGIAFDFYCFRGSATVAHTITIDAGTPVSAGGPVATASFEKTSFSGLASANHDIVIDPGGLAYPSGFLARTSSTGVIVDNSSVSGYTVKLFMTPAQKIQHRAAIGFDLNIIPLTINDYLNQTALATYEGYLDTTVGGLVDYGSVLLVAENESGTPKTIPQSEYAKIMLKIAQKYGCAYIDIPGILGGYDTWNTSGWMTDATHPNTSGSDQYYQELVKWLA